MAYFKLMPPSFRVFVLTCLVLYTIWALWFCAVLYSALSKLFDAAVHFLYLWITAGWHISMK